MTHLRGVMAACLGLAWVAGLVPAGAADDEVLTMVFSKAHNGYERPRLPDGSFNPETYAFGEGEHAVGSASDDSIDALPFLKLAQLLAPMLARQNYLPSRTSAETDLLIMVHWGRTVPFNDGTYRMALDGVVRSMAAGHVFGAQSAAPPTTQAEAARQLDNNRLARAQNNELDTELMLLEMQNHQRDRANAHNAALLGYLPEMNRVGETARIAGLSTWYRDLVADVEQDRYYVILAAYDFATAWKQKQRKLLWVTRVSIRAHGNRFDEQVDAMLRSASRFAGQDSSGLIRRFERQGVVKIGEPKLIEYQTPK